MRSLCIFLTSIVALNAQGWTSLNDTQIKNQDSVITCGYTGDHSLDIRKAITEFTIKLYKQTAVLSNVHFVTSTYSIWQILAAMAEGTNGVARDELFSLLGLPEDECVRETYYQVIATRELPGPDVNLARTRLILVDESLTVSKRWEEFSRIFLLLNTSPAPIKRSPQEVAFIIRQAISSQLTSLNLNGNSVLLDSLDYNGLWSEAFSDVGAVRAPFYNNLGQQIGSVDLMRGRRRVRMAYVAQLNAKVLELQVGHDGRYRMLVAIPLDDKDVTRSADTMTGTVMSEILENLRESLIPVEVAIPRFVMTTELDVRSILEALGVSSLWSDSLATGNISDPAAFPTSFLQRVTVTIDAAGVEHKYSDYNAVPGAFDPLSEADTGLHPKVGRDFIADRPFMYGLFDAGTYTCLIAAAFSIPTYRFYCTDVLSIISKAVTNESDSMIYVSKTIGALQVVGAL